MQSERLRSHAEEERRRLIKIVREQSTALAATTRKIQILRVAHDDKAALLAHARREFLCHAFTPSFPQAMALEAETERRRQLERSLRAACRYRVAERQREH